MSDTLDRVLSVPGLRETGPLPPDFRLAGDAALAEHGVPGYDRDARPSKLDLVCPPGHSIELEALVRERFADEGSVPVSRRDPDGAANVRLPAGAAPPLSVTALDYTYLSPHGARALSLESLAALRLRSVAIATHAFPGVTATGAPLRPPDSMLADARALGALARVQPPIDRVAALSAATAALGPALRGRLCAALSDLGGAEPWVATLRSMSGPSVTVSSPRTFGDAAVVPRNRPVERLRALADVVEAMHRVRVVPCAAHPDPRDGERALRTGADGARARRAGQWWPDPVSGDRLCSECGVPDVFAFASPGVAVPHGVTISTVGGVGPVVQALWCSGPPGSERDLQEALSLDHATIRELVAAEYARALPDSPRSGPSLVGQERLAAPVVADAIRRFATALSHRGVQRREHLFAPGLDTRSLLTQAYRAALGADAKRQSAPESRTR